jgi:hypothetical protein
VVVFDSMEVFNHTVIAANFLAAIRLTALMLVGVMILSLAWLAVVLLLGGGSEGERDIPRAIMAFCALWSILFAIASLATFTTRTYRFGSERFYVGRDGSSGIEKTAIACVLSQPVCFRRVTRLRFYDRNYRRWFDIMIENNDNGQQRIAGLIELGYPIMGKLPRT